MVEFVDLYEIQIKYSSDQADRNTRDALKTHLQQTPGFEGFKTVIKDARTIIVQGEDFNAKLKAVMVKFEEKREENGFPVKAISLEEAVEKTAKKPTGEIKTIELANTIQRQNNELTKLRNELEQERQKTNELSEQLKNTENDWLTEAGHGEKLEKRLGEVLAENKALDQEARLSRSSREIKTKHQIEINRLEAFASRIEEFEETIGSEANLDSLYTRLEFDEQKLFEKIKSVLGLEVANANAARDYIKIYLLSEKAKESLETLFHDKFAAERAKYMKNLRMQDKADKSGGGLEKLKEVLQKEYDTENGNNYESKKAKLEALKESKANFENKLVKTLKEDDQMFKLRGSILEGYEKDIAAVENEIKDYEKNREEETTKTAENLVESVKAYEEKKNDFIDGIQDVLKECDIAFNVNTKREEIKAKIKEKFGEYFPIYLNVSKEENDYKIKIYLPFKSTEKKSDLHIVLLENLLNEKARNLIAVDDFKPEQKKDEEKGLVFYEINLRKADYTLEEIKEIRNEIEDGLERSYNSLSLSELGVKLDLGYSFMINCADRPVEAEAKSDDLDKIIDGNGGSVRRRYSKPQESAERRSKILTVLGEVETAGEEPLQAGEILVRLTQKGIDATRGQLNGDLRALKEEGQLKLFGTGPQTAYGVQKCQQPED